MKIESDLNRVARFAKGWLFLAALAGVVLRVAAAGPGSPADLLEKGIYSEETKGDIDAAMKLYEQVVAEAKGAQGQAAEAQYRLGVCLYKKKNFGAATAAFDKLRSNYPDQKELIARANEYLANSAALLPPPWIDGEESRLEIKFPTGFRVGMANYTVSSGELAGRPVWKLSSRIFAGVQQFSRVEVEANSFKPIHSRWKHSLIGDVDAVYGVNQAELKRKGKDGTTKLTLDGVVYDNEEVIQLIRRLPLASDYKTTLRILPSLGGGGLIPLQLDVSGPEKVEVPAGTFDCYKVEMSVKQTFWYSTDAHRYLVKFEAGGVQAELTSVSQLKPNQPVTYDDNTAAFSVTAPAQWVLYRRDPDEKNGKITVALLDAEAETINDLIVTDLATFGKLRPEAPKTPRAWADLEFADGAKEFKDLQARPSAWKERTVSGNPAISMICDYVDGAEKKVAYAVFSLGKHATEFRFFVPASQFDALQPTFDGIVDSYKEK